MKSYHLPKMDILCANFIAGKQDEAKKLLSQLEEVAALFQPSGGPD